MATVKAYSVAQTARQYGGAAVQSGVYSYSPGTVGAARTGRNGAYDHPTEAGLTEGRTPTLLNGSRAAEDHDVTAIASITTSGTNADIDSATAVVATTTTITGSGAGLIVSFTTTAAGAINGTAGNYTVVDGGEGYVTGNTVEIDGFPGSVVSVTAA